MFRQVVFFEIQAQLELERAVSAFSKATLSGVQALQHTIKVPLWRPF
jgi:hypothetical protein